MSSQYFYPFAKSRPYNTPHHKVRHTPQVVTPPGRRALLYVSRSAGLILEPNATNACNATVIGFSTEIATSIDTNTYNKIKKEIFPSHS